MRLTDASIRALKPQKTEYDRHADGRQGLVLRVRPNGSKSFRMRYSVNGTRAWWTLGEYPHITLKKAIDMHHQALREIAEGLDPKLEEKRRRDELAREAKRLRIGAVTVRNVIAVWAWRHARRERKRPREAVKLLEKYLGEPWKNRPVRELRKKDAVELLDRIVARGAKVMANRVRDLGKQVFMFAIDQDLVEINPFLGVRPPGGKERSRERWLDWHEIKVFWDALENPEHRIVRRMALALRLILVTGQRPGEVAQARIAEFDLERRIWTIPPEHIKTEPRGSTHAHLVPLSDLAIEIIQELIKLAGPRPCLLPNSRSIQNRDRPLHEKTLSHVLSDLVEGGKLFGLEPFKPHDLRRTASTHMSKLGIPRNPVIEKVLNHSDSSTGGVYDRNKYFPEKRDALTRWEVQLREIVSGKRPAYAEI